MPGWTVGQKRGPKSGRVLHSPLGALPWAFAWGLQGVRPIPIGGFKEITDGTHRHPEPARAGLGRRRRHQGRTHDQPPSDAPKIMEGLEPGVDFFAGQMGFEADDLTPRHEPHRGHGPLNALTWGGSIIKYQSSKGELVLGTELRASL